MTPHGIGLIIVALGTAIYMGAVNAPRLIKPMQEGYRAKIMCQELSQRLIQQDSTSKQTAKSFAEVVKFVDRECWGKK